MKVLLIIVGFMFWNAYATFAISQTSGWVLITPPKEALRVVDGQRYFQEQPIERWSYRSAYDTAESCERQKDLLLQRNAEIIKRFMEQKEQGGALQISLDAQWYIGHYRCVPYELWWSKQK